MFNDIKTVRCQVWLVKLELTPDFYLMLFY